MSAEMRIKMIAVPMKSTVPFNKQTVTSINQINVQKANSLSNITNINKKGSTTVRNQCSAKQHLSSTTVHPIKSATQPITQRIPPNSIVPNKPIPPLIHKIQKGQKVPLSIHTPVKLKACIGWNVLNNNCDVDVSAFMLNASGKVLGDDWFVFYGQTQSPDNSTIFSDHSMQDREIISIDMAKLNPSVTKIVFVLTINEALEKKLNFSMIKDAYIRILNSLNNAELVSFKMTEYYSNVTSMMIGELYLYKGKWKFNAIGNGVARDLAGLCEDRKSVV